MHRNGKLTNVLRKADGTDDVFWILIPLSTINK